MAHKDIPAADAIQFRALAGRGVEVVVSLKGHALARAFFSFGESRDLGAQLFVLAEDYDEDDSPHTDDRPAKTQQ